MPNATAFKFGFPDSCVAQTPHWVILLRPQQPTLGALVFVAKAPVQAFGQLSAEAFADLQAVTARAEAVLGERIGYQRMNYLMLMMVDRDVHFHVLPRYEGEREWGGRRFPDAGWPGQPDLGAAQALDPDEVKALAGELAQLWRAPAP